MPNHQAEQGDSTQQTNTHLLAADLRRAAGGGIAAALIVFLGIFLIGQVGDTEAKRLLEAIFPSVRLLCSASMTATATILSLLLTLLSFSVSSDISFKRSHYHRIRQLALFDVVVFVGGTMLLLFTTIPIIESHNTEIYSIFYYGILVACALIGGGLITVILMLFNAIRELVRLADPQDNSDVTEGTVGG